MTEVPLPVPEAFTHALQHHGAGRLSEAEQHYRDILAAHPMHADSLHMLGVIAFQRGRHDSAAAMIGRAVDLNPDQPEAQNNLGNALRGQGRLDDAIACYRAAIALRPGYSAAHHNLGNALAQLRRLDEAAKCFRTAIGLRPSDADTHFCLANALHEQQLLAEAVASYRTALTLRPDDPEALNNLGIALTAQGKLNEAVACLRRAVELAPSHAPASNSLGNALKALGQHDDAIASYRRAIDAAPGDPAAYNNLGLTLTGQRAFDEALACFDRALALRPADAEIHSNFGITLRELGRLDDAIAAHRTALSLWPDSPAAHNNLGNALRDQGQLDDAASCFERAIVLRPGDADAHNNLGLTLQQQGKVSDAVVFYRRALDRKPSDPAAHNNLGMALLAQGAFADGWAEFEWRWKTPLLTDACRHFAQPQWRGEPASGLTLLIHAEQGFGDTLQFCRYAQLAASRGLRVVMEAPAPLLRLLAGLPGVGRLVASGDDLPPFDLHCPMLSLPLALGTTLATIPSAASYLHANPAQVRQWEARLARLSHGVRAGLVWAGRPGTQSASLAAVDRRRSVPTSRLAPLFAVPGVDFFSLQRDGPAPPPGAPLYDFMAEMADFADTAALVANLDLVIAADTAVAHLAAALGKPVWLMDRFDPCWRWLLGRRDSPWYPSVRLYRQRAPGDWDGVMAEIADDLRRLALPARP